MYTFSGGSNVQVEQDLGLLHDVLAALYKAACDDPILLGGLWFRVELLEAWLGRTG